MTEIKWKAPEFHYYHKSMQWYWTSMLFAVFLFAVALWQRNFLFAVFIFIAEIVVFQFGSQLPKLVEFAINDEGIAAGEQKVYHYDALESFSLSEELGEFSELVLKLKNKFTPLIKINIYTSEIPEMRSALEEHLVETVHEGSVFDAIEKLIGF